MDRSKFNIINFDFETKNITNLMKTQKYSPKNLISKNTQCITLEELKHKIYQRRIYSRLQNLQNSKITTIQNNYIEPLNFDKLKSSPQQKVMYNSTTRLPPKKPIQQNKIPRPLTERHKKASNIKKKLSFQDDILLQSRMNSSQSKISQSEIASTKNQTQRKRSDSQKSIQTVADDFKSSFYVIFKELIETFFHQKFLKKKIKYLTSEIWVYILRNVEIQSIQNKQILHEKQIETKKFCLGIYQLIGKQFRLGQIQNMLSKYFPKKNFLLYSDFAEFMNFQIEPIDILIERPYEKEYKQMNPTMLVSHFFKRLIELADLQKKLRLICQANENSLFKFVIEISSGPMLKIQKMTDSLQRSDDEPFFGQKIVETKLVIFLDKILNKKPTKYELIKWLKTEETQNR